MGKYKIAEQLFSPGAASGPTREFEHLFSSSVGDRFDLFPVIYKGKSRGFDKRAITFYKEAFLRIKPDLVVIRGLAIDGYCAIEGARKAKVPCILTGIHGMYSELVYYKRCKKMISRIIERMSINKSDFFYTVCKSSFESNGFLKENREKFLGVLYNSKPDYSSCDKEGGRERIRSQFGIKKDAVVGLFTGRLTKEKGVLMLADALLDFFIRNKNSSFSFLFVGSGPDESALKIKLEPLLNKRVFFAGLQDDVKDFLFAGDIFVFPSFHENHPISILEACEAGLFVIASNTGGIPETILNGVNGNLIPPQNEKAILFALESAIKDKVCRSAYEGQWQSFGKKFSSEVVSDATCKLYKEAIEHNARHKG